MPNTDHFKLKHPRYIICMQWTKFWRSPVHVRQNIFGNHFLKIHSPIHCASFGTFWVQISQLFEQQWVFKDLWEIVFGDIFLRRRRNPNFSGIFKDSLWLEYFINGVCDWLKSSNTMTKYVTSYYDACRFS